MSAPSGGADWAVAMSQVVCTPAGYEDWVPAGEALRILRCAESSLIDLVDTGLPTRDGRFDWCDAWNVGLYSGSGRSMPELEMKLFRRLLSAFNGDWHTPMRYLITVEAACPSGPDCDCGTWVCPDFVDASLTESTPGPGRRSWSGVVEASGVRVAIRSRVVTDAWNSVVRSYRYHFTRLELAKSVDQTRRRRVGDCVALTKLLQAELAKCGVEAWERHGYLLGWTTGHAHSWLEIRDIDGVVKPLDASLALLAGSFLNPGLVGFSLGCLMNRLIQIRERGKVQVIHHCHGDRLDLWPSIVARHL